MLDGQVRKYSARLYFYECPALFGNRTSRNLGVLVQMTSRYFKILRLFYPLFSAATPERHAKHRGRDNLCHRFMLTEC